MQPERRRHYEDRGLLTAERFGQLFDSAVEQWPDRELLNYEGERYSYLELWRWVVHVAHALVDSGLRPGDHILNQMSNSAESIVLQFAVWRIGCINVPVIPVYREHEVRQIIADTRPVAIVATAQVRNRNLCNEIAGVLAELPGLSPRLLSFSEAAPAGWHRLPAAPDAAVQVDGAGLPDPADSRECAMILYTSGSTSAPKGAMLTGEAILANSRAYIRSNQLTASYVGLAGSPLGHIAALSICMTTPMLLGGRSVVMSHWKPDEAVAHVLAERVTMIGGPPIFTSDIVDRLETMGRRLEWQMLSQTGGAPIAPEIVRRAEAVGIRAVPVYGMTETTGAAAMCRLDDPLDRRAEWHGRAIWGTEIEAVDDERRRLPADEIGELRIRSPQLMLGYTDPDISAQQIDADGWFYTGDLGIIDAEGWVRVVGRLKEIINRGGEKFSAQDIEQALGGHPDIAAAAVVGGPHERLGEIVVAFLKLRPDVAWQGPERLLAYLDGLKLSKQKFPEAWHIVDELPMSATGKIQKKELVARLKYTIDS